MLVVSYLCLILSNQKSDIAHDIIVQLKERCVSLTESESPPQLQGEDLLQVLYICIITVIIMQSYEGKISQSFITSTYVNRNCRFHALSRGVQISMCNLAHCLC